MLGSTADLFHTKLASQLLLLYGFTHIVWYGHNFKIVSNWTLLPSREGTFTAKFTGHIFILRTKTKRKLDIPHTYKSISRPSQKMSRSKVKSLLFIIGLAWLGLTIICLNKCVFSKVKVTQVLVTLSQDKPSNVRL